MIGSRFEALERTTANAIRLPVVFEAKLDARLTKIDVCWESHLTQQDLCVVKLEKMVERFMKDGTEKCKYKSYYQPKGLNKIHK